jgi:hypothetical protein
MTTRTRLDKARTKLTPKQIALHMVKEAHAAGTPLEYTRRTLLEGPEGTICGRIERSMTGEVRGKRTGYTDEMTQRLRDAQREGMFLFGLATRCWFGVIEAREALDLRWLLWNMALMAQQSWSEWTKGTTFEDEESPMPLERVGTELRRVRDDVLALKRTVEIIEARYFGMPVLFPKDREWLEDLAEKAVEMLATLDQGLRSKTIEEWAAMFGHEESARKIVAALAEPEGRDSAKAADAKHVQAAATKNAKVWIRLLQAQIHNGMGEESAGTSMLSEAMELLETAKNR